MKIFCILNPTAGGGKLVQPVCDELRRLFAERQIASDIVLTQGHGEGTRLAAAAVQQGYTMIVAGGGDGTLNDIASGVVGTSATLGILPIGSGNGLARSLRIPLNYQAACRVLLTGRVRAIDVGQVGTRYFFVTSGVGFDAQIGKHYNEQVQAARGIWPYFTFALKQYFHYTPQPIQVTCQGQTWDYTPFVATVANAQQYGAGAIIAPQAVLDDGLLNLSIVPPINVFQALWWLPRLFSGNIHTMPGFRSHQATALTITRAAPGPAHVDGEPFEAGTMLAYTILPQALKVCVPSSA